MAWTTTTLVNVSAFCKRQWSNEATRISRKITKPTTHFFSSIPPKEEEEEKVRLSKLLSQHATNLPSSVSSRRSIERAIQDHQITLAGKVISNPAALVSWKEVKGALSFNNQLILFSKNATQNKAASTTERARVWLAHKLKGEIVSHNDPHNRPSLLERLRRGGVGPPGSHLKTIGRLDMSTEGLILLTNSGQYAHEMELPSNAFYRSYRVRVHGFLTQSKLMSMRNGLSIEGVKYKAMGVHLESNNTQDKRRKVGRKKVAGGGTNHWLRVTCTEGKNRQIRRVMQYLGLNVTRLIRISYGDYDLNTIPPGMAIEVPIKPVECQKKHGRFTLSKKKGNKNARQKSSSQEDVAPPVEWIRH